MTIIREARPVNTSNYDSSARRVRGDMYDSVGLLAAYPKAAAAKKIMHAYPKDTAYEQSGTKATYLPAGCSGQPRNQLPIIRVRLPAGCSGPLCVLSSCTPRLPVGRSEVVL